MTPKKKASIERAQKRFTKPTGPQLKYLPILFNDCGFTTGVQRNAYLETEVGREIKFLDELTFDEARELISKLKTRRDNRRDDSDREVDDFGDIVCGEE